MLGLNKSLTCTPTTQFFFSLHSFHPNFINRGVLFNVACYNFIQSANCSKQVADVKVTHMYWFLSREFINTLKVDFAYDIEYVNHFYENPTVKLFTKG